MELNDTQRVYFVGAGGIGMAALARFYMSKALPVAGYDRTPSALTADLVAEGAQVSYDDSIDAIPLEFRLPEGTLAVYTPAVPADNKVLSFFRDHGFELRKRAWVLGQVTRASKSLCFSGTHGKTTTSSMAAHILHCSEAGCNAFLGGILKGYNSNLMLSATSPWSVVEADEYDRSFHQLTPYIAVVNATDPDHLDIYGDEAGYLEGFARFTELVRPDGYLVVHTGLKLKPRPQQGVKVFSYSKDEGDFHAENVVYGQGEIRFDFIYPGGRIDGINLGVPVEINIENAVAALAACQLTGELDPDVAREAIGSFMGAKRRFEFHLKEPGRAIIDDYAHHPDELRASIRSVKKLYPGKRLTVIFQPHLYSRTNDFYREFADALSEADEVMLLPIYPARELPMPGVTSELILNEIKCDKKRMLAKEELVDTIKKGNFEILLTAGAGDIADIAYRS